MGPERLRAAVRAIVERGGSNEREAQLVADQLVEANLTGHDSHGVGMVPRYVEALAEGGLRVNQQLTVVTDSGALLMLDGNAGYGQVMAFDAMRLGIGAPHNMEWRASAWPTATTSAWLYRYNQALLEQRIRFAKRSALPADKLIMSAGLALIPVYLVLPGLDAVRFGWAPAPQWIQAAAFAGVAAGLAVLAWVMVENTYLSRFVEVQPGQRVVTSGPYRFVRHPLCAAMTVYFLAVPLGLGSFWGLLPGAGLAGLLLVRTAVEDRTLLRDLPGYREYAERVRWRLVPGIW